ncbi:hypothetical protein [Aquitalea sp. USM4]|uniref:hypothetical protein n=1 Tax=Aquitalea sp. USM4 TaxID=1590041 RepID=UPI00103B28AB|nr:hypothetical protein [Aquitalea sp. USM4]
MKQDELLEVNRAFPMGETMKAARKVIEVAIWLIRHGYGRLLILPYASPSGCHWRCEYHLQGDMGWVLYRYSTANGFRFLADHSGGYLHQNVSVKKLAMAIMASVPEELRQACEGDVSPEMGSWLDALEQSLESGYLPDAFNNCSEDDSIWSLVKLSSGVRRRVEPPPGYLSPTAFSRMADQLNSDVEEGWATFQAIQAAKHMVISPQSIAKLLQSEQSASQFMAMAAGISSSSPFDGHRKLSALIAAVLSQAQAVSESGDAAHQASLRLISEAAPAEPVARRGARLLAAVHELHKAGYQQLRISAGWSADGSEWRCRLLPASSTGIDGWRGHGIWPEYVSTQGQAYFGWDDCQHDDARALARKVLERFPELSGRIEGQDWAYAGWFTDVLGRAEHGELPAFYQNGFPDDGVTPWPPAFNVFSNPVISDTGWPLISNGELGLADLPEATTEEAELLPFCLSYDGYDGFRTIEDCLLIADRIQRHGLPLADLDSLRIAAFIHQRALKWESAEGAGAEIHLQAICQIINEIRVRLIKAESLS